MNIANPGDFDRRPIRLWFFQFGVHPSLSNVGGHTDRVYVWANLEGLALQVAGDWLEEHAPKHLVAPEEIAGIGHYGHFDEADLTYTEVGDARPILSSEWSVDEISAWSDRFDMVKEESRVLEEDVCDCAQCVGWAAYKAEHHQPDEEEHE
jgi:hypothetical protein